ncbi:MULTISPECIES: sialidase family protein [Acidobacterium]|nr:MULTISPECIES: sialidase family protein [Acidobacterium]
MNQRQRFLRVFSFACCCAFLLCSAQGWAATPAQAAASNVQSSAKSAPLSQEYLLLGTPNRGAGEPWVVVNPKDPDNILVVAMATLNRLPSGEPPMPMPAKRTWNSPWTQLRIKELSVPNGSLTDTAVTRDGGKTWKFGQDAFRSTLKKNRCSDSFAGAGANGTLYYGCLAYLNPGAADYADGYAPDGEARFYHGGSAIAWSTDKGATWSQPVWVHPEGHPSLYPTVHPVFEQASPVDRPVFVQDASTGTIYVSSIGFVYTVDPKTVPRPEVNPKLPGKGYDGLPPANDIRFVTFIRASHDGGHTWGDIYPLDESNYPGFVGIYGFTAAFGHLVIAYNAQSVPASMHANCPCAVLGISQNDGKSLRYSLIPPLPAATNAKGTPRAFGLAAGVMIAADPMKQGRYAVARQAGSQIFISLTNDSGKSWQHPVLAAQLPPGAKFGHLAMKYSSSGDLGLIWQAIYPGGSFDMWSSASLDNANTFHTVRISHAISPPCNPDRCNFLLGNDLSSMTLDKKYLYAVWGDNRSGFEGTWFGRVPLSAYKGKSNE